MAAAATLQLKNYAAVEQAFAVDTVKTGEYAKWADRSQGTFLGTAYASLTRKSSPLATGVRKVQGKITYPTINGTTGALDRTHIGTFELVIPNSGTLTERRELAARLRDFIIDAVITAAVDNDEMPWG